MRQDIEKALLRLQIEVKFLRKRMVRNLLTIIPFIIILSLLYFVSPTSLLIPFIGLILGVLLFFASLFVIYLFRPYEREEQAFKKIAEAIKVLEKSNEPIAYAEAYRCLERAHKILRGREPQKVNWYNDVNKTLKQFIEDLELIVLPATSSSNIKVKHLEEIALAVYNTNPTKLEEINKTLEDSYTKLDRTPTKTYVQKFREHMVGKVLISLGFGYGLVLMICLIYVFATQQDLIIFARERPDIVVLGGLGVSGITFWRTK